MWIESNVAADRHRLYLSITNEVELLCHNIWSSWVMYICFLNTNNLFLHMSQFIESRVLNYIEHLTTDVTVNPLQATADYIASFLMPCTLPSWSRHVQLAIAVAFLIMLFQSVYILNVRSKTKNMFNIGLSGMGLIQLDRANHCGLCYLLYSIIAIVEIICEEFVRSGRLDQAWPNFILGVKFTATLACASVILWLCICHCALFKQRAIAQHKTPVGKWLPTTVTWGLNLFLMAIIFAPTVSIVISFSQLTMESLRVRHLVTPIIQIFRKKALTCSLGTCSVIEMVPYVVPLKRATDHLDLLVKHLEAGLNSYIFCCAFLFVIYIPFLFLLFQSFTSRDTLDSLTKRHQEGVFVNTSIEFTITLVILILASCARGLVQNGNFIFNPTFWLLLRIGINSSISILGNTALFLILYSLQRTNLTKSNTHVAMSKSKSEMDDMESEMISA